MFNRQVPALNILKTSYSSAFECLSDRLNSTRYETIHPWTKLGLNAAKLAFMNADGVDYACSGEIYDGSLGSNCQ